MSEAQPNMCVGALGRALKTLRQRTGMNLDDAATRIGLPNGTTLSKVENAERLVSTTALGTYFTTYDIGEKDARRDEIRKLATLAGSTRRANLRSQYGDAVPKPSSTPPRSSRASSGPMTAPTLSSTAGDAGEPNERSRPSPNCACSARPC
ncbi:helix-turn-helix domain-containing protein [Streptomyces decoyicus]|uniref:helix-turn-helix domain-containing protein n=1 Tax=Streptomyces decoyicus TaxID=249567 RepID=UPI003632235E